MPVNKFGRNPRTNIASSAAHTTVRIVETLNKDEDFLLSIGTDDNRTLGCVDLTENKTFTLNLGDTDNKIVHTKGRGINLTVSENLEISSSSNAATFKIGELNGYKITNLPNPVNSNDAATMEYVRQMYAASSIPAAVATPQCRIKEGYIPNAPYTHIVLMRFDQQTLLINVYVECNDEQWIDATCSNFAEINKNFRLYLKNNCLFCYFTSTSAARRYKIIYL
jgi:hypothetical protein